jgi:hypothetical protein
MFTVDFIKGISLKVEKNLITVFYKFFRENNDGRNRDLFKKQLKFFASLDKSDIIKFRKKFIRVFYI